MIDKDKLLVKCYRLAQTSPLRKHQTMDDIMIDALLDWYENVEQEIFDSNEFQDYKEKLIKEHQEKL